MYDYDANAILAEPLPNRQAKVIVTAYNKCYDKLTRHGHEVKLFILNNECSNDLKAAILKTESIKIEDQNECIQFFSFIQWGSH